MPRGTHIALWNTCASRMHRLCQWINSILLQISEVMGWAESSLLAFFKSLPARNTASLFGKVWQKSVEIIEFSEFR